MTYALPFDIHLGMSMAGLTDLRAQVADAAGAPVGAPIATGFVDAGYGNYYWYYGGFADNFVGFVSFYRAAYPTVTLTAASVDPCCSAPGTSAYAFDYTVEEHTTHLPIDGAEVWITTDLAGANTIWHGWSDVFGQPVDNNGAAPWLIPGIYYVWAKKPGYTTDAWPDTEVQP